MFYLFEVDRNVQESLILILVSNLVSRIKTTKIPQWFMVTFFLSTFLLYLTQSCTERVGGVDAVVIKCCRFSCYISHTPVLNVLEGLMLL